MSFDLVAKTAATFANGTAFGALSFVSFVDTRMLFALSAKNDASAVKSVFPIWWPLGRDFMAPLGILGIGLNAYSFYGTGDPIWLVPATTSFGIIVWTASVMGNAIKNLRQSEEKDSVAKGTPNDVAKFCLYHHVRTVLAGVGFCVSLFALTSSTWKFRVR
ncbi:hypothetical protein HDU83_004943 [Entophlyctis luteolus]|nr:hypothetical protein HDU83_004943 [Entophlyctis luteolus]KAJ3381804.1 hypothetical protein HDU84_004843 [Entophlyctis sp. JEL0112]